MKIILVVLALTSASAAFANDTACNPNSTPVKVTCLCGWMPFGKFEQLDDGKGNPSKVTINSNLESYQFEATQMCKLVTPYENVVAAECTLVP